MKPGLSTRAKLIGITQVILLVSSAAIIGTSAHVFTRDTVRRAQENNSDSARLLAQTVRSDLIRFTEKMRLLGMNLLQPLSPAQLATMRRPLFDQEQELLAETVIALTPKVRTFNRAANEAVLGKLDIAPLEVFELANAIPAKVLTAGEETIVSGQVKGSIPVMTIAFPLVTNDQGVATYAVVATFKKDRFTRAVSGDGLRTSYLVDRKGSLLAHRDPARAKKRENLAQLPIVNELLTGKGEPASLRFADPETGVAYLGAFRKVGFAGIGVVSQVDEAQALVAAAEARNLSLGIAGVAALIAFLAVFRFGSATVQEDQPEFETEEAPPKIEMAPPPPVFTMRAAVTPPPPRPEMLAESPTMMAPRPMRDFAIEAETVPVPPPFNGPREVSLMPPPAPTRVPEPSIIGMEPVAAVHPVVRPGKRRAPALVETVAPPEISIELPTASEPKYESTITLEPPPANDDEKAA